MVLKYRLKSGPILIAVAQLKWFTLYKYWLLLLLLLLLLLYLLDLVLAQADTTVLYHKLYSFIIIF